MNRPTDPALEIRDALDREVRRTFDAGRLVAALEEGQAAERARARAERDRGPFGRVPATIQWIGVAAAIVAAATGLRSLYLDLAAPEPRPVAVERASVEPPPIPHERVVRPSVEHEAPPPARSPVRAPVQHPEPAGEAARAPEPANEPPPIARQSEEDAGKEPSERQGSPPPALVVPRPEPGPPELTAPSGEPPVAEVAEGGVMATFPGTPPEGAGGVRVTSLRFAGRTELTAEVREVPSIGATLVTIRGRAGRSARGPVRPDEPAANEPSVAGASDEGSYLLSMLVGFAFDLLPEDEHVWLGEGLVVVRPGDLDPWEATASRNRFLETSFDLRSIVTLDGVRIPPDSGDSSPRLIAVAGGKLYEITVSGTPTDVQGQHRISIGLSRTYPGSERGAAAAIEATILIDGGRRAVLVVPDPVLEGKQPEPAVDTVFVGISPRFEALTMPRRVRERLERAEIVDRPDQPAVLLVRVEPQYPVEAVEYGAHGEVSLRALVGRNGSVEAVTVVELPRDEGAEFLAAAAAGAVRKWRYLPAHHRGRDVSAWVDITLYF